MVKGEKGKHRGERQQWGFVRVQASTVAVIQRLGRVLDIPQGEVVRIALEAYITDHLLDTDEPPFPLSD